MENASKEILKLKEKQNIIQFYMRPILSANLIILAAKEQNSILPAVVGQTRDHVH